MKSHYKDFVTIGQHAHGGETKLGTDHDGLEYHAGCLVASVQGNGFQ